MELFKRNNNRYYFRVIADTGHNMLSGDGYETLEECKNIVAQVKKNIMEPHFISFENSTGDEWKFIINSKEGAAIGYSMDFHNKKQCANWLHLMQEHLPPASISDLTAVRGH